MSTDQTYEALSKEIEMLKIQLEEAHDTINAIREGQVDAFIVKNDEKHELYTLKSADKTYRIFIEKMNEGAVTLNSDNMILYCNSSFAEYVHSGMSSVIGLPFKTFFPESHQSKVDKLIAAAWNNIESKGETLLLSQSRMIPVLLSMNTMEIDNETVLSIIITDLSLQKEMQEQKKVIEQKDEFISIVSHELKTPLTSVKGYVQILKYNFEQQENHKAAEMLGKADMQLNKLSNLIKDVLDVKKMENGQLRYNREKFDFNELVEEIVEETARVLVHHDIIKELSVTCLVYGDRNKIGQVITNFLDNAAKYSSQGSPIIISTSFDNGSVTLSVKDNGIGVPADQHDKIFERFYRVNSEKENTYSGIGLGLYIASEIVKRHEGVIGVQSGKDKGSVFYFMLPVISNN